MEILIGLVGVFFGFLITVYVVRITSLKAARGGRDYWLKMAIFFLLMVLGMLAREAYNSLVHTRSFNWISLGLAGLVSPMIFGAVYSGLGNLDIKVPSIVLAFQNGFFWNSIFEGLGPQA
jgi:hypothetical protein